MPRSRPIPEPPIAPEQDRLIVSARLASGKFSSEISIPLLGTTTEQKDQFMQRWIELIETGFRLGIAELSAEFKKD